MTTELEPCRCEIGTENDEIITHIYEVNEKTSRIEVQWMDDCGDINSREARVLTRKLREWVAAAQRRKDQS
jgi:hypothetical protein